MADDDDDVKEVSPGDKFVIVMAILLLTAVGAFCVYGMVQISVDFNDGDDVNDSMNLLQEELKNLTLISNDCFTCDTTTGNVLFNSTLDIQHDRVSSFSLFSEKSADAGLTGVTFPGKAFLNSPLSPFDRAETFLGDVIQSVGAGYSQRQAAVGLGAAQSSPGDADFTPEDGGYPNPMSFTNSRTSSVVPTPDTQYYLLGLGEFDQNTQPVRCNSASMSPSPAVYFVRDTTPSPAQIHMCVCASNANPGGGEHCTSALFTTGVF